MKRIIAIACTGILLAGCEPATPPPPPDSVLNQGMAESLLDTGFYAEIAITQILGRHYNPSERAWRVFACFRFVLADGQEGASCVDSFQALALDNGTWVVAVTIDGVYRWRAIGAGGDSQGAADTVIGIASPIWNASHSRWAR